MTPNRALAHAGCKPVRRRRARFPSDSPRIPVVDDADDREIGRKILGSSRIPRCRGTDTDHPVARDAALRFDRHTARSAVLFLQVEQWAMTYGVDAVGRDLGFFFSLDSH